LANASAQSADDNDPDLLPRSTGLQSDNPLFPPDFFVPSPSSSLSYYETYPSNLNGEPLPTSFVSKDDLRAIISHEAIAKAGTYIVTLKCEGESFPESHRAHLVVGFKP